MSEPVEIVEIQADLADQEAWCTGGLTGKTNLPPWEREWCSNIPPECEAMQEACKPAPPSEGCQPQSETRPAPSPSFKPLDIPVADTLQTVTVTILVLLTTSAVIAYFRLRPADIPPPSPKPGSLPGDRFRQEEVINLSELPDPLAAAQYSLKEGNIGRAYMILRALALDALEKRGRLVLHPSRTDREYVRALSGYPGERELLSQLVREIECQRYAARPADESSVQRAFDATRKLLEQA